MIKSIYEYLIW